MKKRSRKSMAEKQNAKPVRIKNIILDIGFYLTLIVLIIISLTISGKNSSGPRSIGGFSAFVVLTGSMEEVIPKGSLVVTQKVDSTELQIGDDITYMVSATSTVTHRIIGIEENYLETGERAFYTQCVMNSAPDSKPVAAVNVVGKVVYHNKTLGTVVNYAKDNWPLIAFFVCILLFFAKTAEYILKKEDDTKQQTSLEGQPEQMEAGKEDEDNYILEIIEL